MKTYIRFLTMTCFLLGLNIGLGCTSIKSSPLLRSSDGKFSAWCIPQATRGVPCKFKVETGIRAVISETIYIDPLDGKTIVPENRIYDVATEPVFSDQVFMVHIPRPFAGTLDLMGEDGTKKGYHFNTDGYLEKIGGKIDDQTINDITSILAPESLGGFIKTASTPGSDDLQEQKRVIAVREFTLADPNWHLELNEWINQFNSCHVLCGTECQAEIVADPAMPYTN